VPLGPPVLLTRWEWGHSDRIDDRDTSSYDSRLLSTQVSLLSGGMLSLMERFGYLIVFLGVMLEGVGIPLPGETVLIAAGALAHRGHLTLW
jgi:hypothetical protein